MPRSSAVARLARRSAALAGVLALGVAGTASADITGTVKNAAGVGVPGASIQVTEATGGGFASFATTDALGRYAVPTSSLSGDTPPFVVTAEFTDRCRRFPASALTVASAPVNDGAVQDLTLDAFTFCTGDPAFGETGITGNAWPERGLILSPPGGLTTLRVLAPSSQTGLRLTLADGTQVGAGDDSGRVPLTAPAAGYNGLIYLAYTGAGNVPVSVPIGTLTAGAIGTPKRPTGPFDLAAIVDISGSMSGADPTFRRKDAVQLLVDLAGTGDRLVGTGFDDEFTEIFGRTTVSSVAVRNALKAAARSRIVNDGGTDYDVGFSNAFTALAAEPLEAQVPKAAIFLTDGAHNGTYFNTHLRFAYNGTGSPWPVCVVQLGKLFSAEDAVRLKRIAAETGGIYRAAPNNSQLEDLYFQCRGNTSGARVLFKKKATFRVGQARTYGKKIVKGQRKATFFVSWGKGRYALRVTKPGAKKPLRIAGKNVRLVKGRTFAFIEVRNPVRGIWRLRVQRLKTGLPQDQATTTISVARKR